MYTGNVPTYSSKAIHIRGVKLRILTLLQHIGAEHNTGESLTSGISGYIPWLPYVMLNQTETKLMEMCSSPSVIHIAFPVLTIFQKCIYLLTAFFRSPATTEMACKQFSAFCPFRRSLCFSLWVPSEQNNPPNQALCTGLGYPAGLYRATMFVRCTNRK